MIASHRVLSPGVAAQPGASRWRSLKRAALALPEGVAFRVLEGAAFRRVFSPRRDTLESDALRVVEKAALGILDWVAVRSVG